MFERDNLGWTNPTLQDALSDLILEYINHGLIDQLKIKWFQPAPCASDIRKPTPLTFTSVSGVYVFLVVGFILSLMVMCCERCAFKSVADLRRKSKDSFWKSRKLMFFSQVTTFSRTVDHGLDHEQVAD